MNQKTAKLLNRLAGKAKRPSRGFKRTWLSTPPSARAELRAAIMRELGPRLRPGRLRLSDQQRRVLAQMNQAAAAGVAK